MVRLIVDDALTIARAKKAINAKSPVYDDEKSALYKERYGLIGALNQASKDGDIKTFNDIIDENAGFLAEMTWIEILNNATESGNLLMYDHILTLIPQHIYQTAIFSEDTFNNLLSCASKSKNIDMFNKVCSLERPDAADVNELVKNNSDVIEQIPGLLESISEKDCTILEKSIMAKEFLERFGYLEIECRVDKQTCDDILALNRLAAVNKVFNQLVNNKKEPDSSQEDSPSSIFQLPREILGEVVRHLKNSKNEKTH